MKDIDLRGRVLTVRGGNGDADRRTVLPETLVEAIVAQIATVRATHLRDLRRGGGYFRLPEALDRTMPAAARDWRWGWLLPAAREYVDRETGQRFRHHIHASSVQRAISIAGVRAGINQRVTAHTMRHSFATQLIRAGYDIRTVQALLGHRDLNTTRVYLQVLDRGSGVRSPLDLLRDVQPRAGTDSGEGSSSTTLGPHS
jgi:integrase